MPIFPTPEKENGERFERIVEEGLKNGLADPKLTEDRHLELECKAFLGA